LECVKGGRDVNPFEKRGRFKWENKVIYQFQKRSMIGLLGGKKPNCLFLDPRYIGKQLSNYRGELHWKTIQMFTLSRGMGGKKGWRKRKKLYIHYKRGKRLEGKNKIAHPL
jgi:hypothetical protein